MFGSTLGPPTLGPQELDPAANMKRQMMVNALMRPVGGDPGNGIGAGAQGINMIAQALLSSKLNSAMGKPQQKVVSASNADVSEMGP